MWYHLLKSSDARAIASWMPYGYWIQPNGKATSVAPYQHETMIADKFEDTANAIYRGNWIRIVNPGIQPSQRLNTMQIEFMAVTPAQLSTIKNIIDEANEYTETKGFALAVELENNIDGIAKNISTSRTNSDTVAYLGNFLEKRKK